ncbi:transposase [Micromonospora aurantiaca]|uniref:transposase n=1 Tax=Micromonospora aurantiaca (nom. illeg.) TaxID=47850 RepID=UPI00379EDE3E
MSAEAGGITTRHDRRPERPPGLLRRFYTPCAATNAELHRLATTIETWWPPIHAFLTTRLTNAGLEGTIRVIKTVARDAYGFRNPDNQRYAFAPPPPNAAAGTPTPLNFDEPPP